MKTAEISSKNIMSRFIGTLINDWYALMWCIAPGRAPGGQRDVPIFENGQSPCILPSDPYDIPAKLKSAVMRNDRSMRDV